MGRSRRFYPLYFIAPAFIVYFAFFIYPAISGFFYSFTDWNSYVPRINFIGLGNFKRLFTEGVLNTAITNTLLYAVAVTIFVNLIGLILASMLNTKVLFANLFRTVFYTPVVIAPLIVGYIFTAIYNPHHGILNQFLRLVGLKLIAVDWLGNVHTAMFAVIATGIWQSSGFAMVIYLAGLKTIPKELIEQASVDGAPYLSRFRHVTFPLLAPSFTVNVLFSTISSLKVFETVFVLTNGGPGFATEVINTFVYRQFAQGEWGYATAAGLLLTIIIGAIAIVLLRLLRKREVEF